jgi:hypothetical protein
VSLASLEITTMKTSSGPMGRSRAFSIEAALDAAIEVFGEQRVVDRLLRDGVRMFTNRAISRTCFVTQAPLKPSEASEETRQDIAEKRAAIER